MHELLPAGGQQTFVSKKQLLGRNGSLPALAGANRTDKSSIASLHQGRAYRQRGVNICSFKTINQNTLCKNNNATHILDVARDPHVDRAKFRHPSGGPQIHRIFVVQARTLGGVFFLYCPSVPYAGGSVLGAGC
eukprot:3207014-Amphidinium_carterae.1